MEKHESIDYLTSLQRRRPKLGTETTAKMLSHLGHPEDGIDCVQIGGSNGKGSTARMLESVLRAAGLDVGLFTSPSLNDIHEQIRVNGRMIPKRRINDYVDTIRPCIERLRGEDDMPTHFEVLTALAIHHFSSEDVDVAVLEVGIGGRYDATSAVDPVASAVTSVSLEHTDLLGETIEEIARDTAQVAPSETPLVTGADREAVAAIRRVTDAVTVGSRDTDVVAVETGMHSDTENDVSITGADWTLETHLSLLGQHQATNAGVAATLARQIASVDAPTIATGLRTATWPGRFEIVSTDPLVVLDGAHNPGATAALSDLLGRYDYDSLRVVFGVMEDKDYERMIAELPAIDMAFATRPDNDRAEDVAAVADAFDGHADRIYQVESIPVATERALTADPSDFVLVTGSLSVVADVRDQWTDGPAARSNGPQATVEPAARRARGDAP